MATRAKKSHEGDLQHTVKRTGPAFRVLREASSTGKLVTLSDAEFDALCEDEITRGPLGLYLLGVVAVTRGAFAAYHGVDRSQVSRWLARGLDGCLTPGDAIALHSGAAWLDFDRSRRDRQKHLPPAHRDLAASMLKPEEE